MLHKNSKKTIITFTFRLLPFLISIILIAGLLFSDAELSAEALISYAPSAPLPAACFLLLMYALKSLSAVFPIIILYVASGYLFSPGVAILVNATGLILCYTIPYMIGRFCGAAAIERWLLKHPKLCAVEKKQKDNPFFICFFLRVINCLPGDLVSLYLGSLKIPYWRYYLPASFLGTFPGLVLATLIGTSITEPSSPLFIISLTLTVLFTVISLLFYHHHNRKLKQERN